MEHLGYFMGYNGIFHGIFHGIWEGLQWDISWDMNWISLANIGQVIHKTMGDGKHFIGALGINIDLSK